MSIFNKLKKTKAADEQEAVAVPKSAKKTEAETDGKKAEKQPVAVNQPTAGKKTKAVRNLAGVLVKPLVTEKSAALAGLNQYVFAVSVKANKLQIAEAIAGRYGVKPTRVNIINNSGRQVRYGRSYGRTKDWKKAIITLPQGKSIQIQEGV